MRWVKATLIYCRTKNLRAVQLLLGHTKLDSTVRYVGIEIDDALRDFRTDRILGSQKEAVACFQRLTILNGKIQVAE